MKFILTSCGLSLLTNFLRDNFNILPKEVYKFSNLKKTEVEKDFLALIDKAVEKLKNQIKKYSNEELRKLSAELNALISFYNGEFNNKDMHYLFVTDTYLGEVVVDILKDFLISKGLQVQKFIAKDLNTSSLEEFEMALSDVIKDLSEDFEGYKSSGYEIIFNLTGGYKSVNSFLQTMATLWADKSIYIFESSNELLEIPKLPLKLDNEIFDKYFEIFKKLEENGVFNEEELKNIPSSLYIKIDKNYGLSSWGAIVWEKYKNEYMKKNLIPLIDNVKFSKEFLKDFEKLNPSEKYQINKTLQKLENYILKNENLKSLRYHSLSGEIAQKYSHEFYPFDGNDSRRVFCNEENNKIILEKIDDHLK